MRINFNASARTVFFFMGLFIISTLFPPAITSEEIPHGIGSWDEATLGNHRAVFRVEQDEDVVWVHLPWRRRDFNPEKKNIIVIDAQTNERLKFVHIVEINREFGDLIVKPVTIPGEYYVYYMPYEQTLSWGSYPDYIYPGQDPLLSSGQVFMFHAWLTRHGLSPERPADAILKDIPQAKVLEFQAVDDFDSFFPMEVIATAAETNRIISDHPDDPFLLFPEDREHPIRMYNDLPFRWVKTGPRRTFQGNAHRGEYYSFQIGVFASRQPIEDLKVSMSDLENSVSGKRIPAASLTCFNTEGNDVQGQRFQKILPIERGNVRPLWLGVDIPKNISPGTYSGTVTIQPEGLSPADVRLELKIDNTVLEDHGDSEPWRHSRLRWLNSKIALDDDVVAPFTPMTVKSRSVSCLGRTVELGESGFPVRMQSFFAPEVTHLEEKGRDILAQPIEMVVETRDRRRIPFQGNGAKITRRAAGAVSWEATSAAEGLTMDCSARMEFDGHIEFKIAVKADRPTRVEDIRLEIPIAAQAARYMMGMGRSGGFRPSQHLWTWSAHRLQDSAWVGDVNAGVQIKLKGENYKNILSSVYSRFKDSDKPFINLPPAWYNQGRGGCVFLETGDDTFLVRAYSGPRTVEPGESLNFHFTLLLTPFKTLNPDKHFNTRYFHNYRPVKDVLAVGANTINIHHGREINPFINYPFLRIKELKDYVNEVHDQGLKLKIYYTSRELTNRTVELWALKSLDHEVFAKGQGKGFPWLQEHFGSDYVPAWVVRRIKDAAIATGGNSRWHNYYLEGLNWIIKQTGIDGIYLDDVDFDRDVIKRIRKVMDRTIGEGALIDFHSCNHFMDRFGWGVCANLHLEHMPYIDSLWFGEYFDYDLPPDYWLVEVSGIPFGLMGEMLQDGGNPWRGMLYGAVTRRALPTDIWKVWDEVDIRKSRMIGFWSPSCPVKTDHSAVPATAYVGNGQTLVSMASWAEGPVDCRLNIDWQALGIDPAKARITAPAIKDFQDEASFKPGDTIPVKPGRGWLLIISE